MAGTCADIREDLMEMRDDIDKVTNGGGCKVMLTLFSTYFFFCKSIARDFVLATVVPFFTQVLGEDTQTTNNMYTTIYFPFSLKPLWGSLLVALPCVARRKRLQILCGVACSVISLYSVLSIGLKYENKYVYPGFAVVQISAVLFCAFEIGGCVVDALMQQSYTNLVKQTDSTMIISYVWGLITFGSMVSAFGNLLFLQEWWLILLQLALPLMLPMIVPIALNWMAADLESAVPVGSLRTRAGMQSLAATALLGFGGIGGSVLLITEASILQRCIFFSSVSIAFVVLVFAVLPRNTAIAALYMFLCSGLKLLFPATLQIWYTGSNDIAGKTACLNAHNGTYCSPTKVQEFVCIPDGPMFSTSYYQFFGKFIDAFAALLAIAIFERVVSHWNVRPAFWVTTLGTMCSAFLEVMILQRWNHTLLGTDPLDPDQTLVDQAFFLLGARALDNIIITLDFIPASVLISLLCTDEMEATAFAILGGGQNFLTMYAQVAGAIALEMLGVNFDILTNECTNPEYEIFGISLNGLSIARILGGIVLPAITIPLTFVMLPDGRLSSYLEDKEEIQMQSTQSSSVGLSPRDIPLTPTGLSPHRISAGLRPIRGLTGSTGGALSHASSITSRSSRMAVMLSAGRDRV